MSGPPDAGGHVLIVGGGSVGRRHARNLHALGCRISVVDPRADRRAELAAETPTVGAFADVGEALGRVQCDGAVIASPTAFHVDQALACLALGGPVLLEKPVSPGLDEAIRLAQAVCEGSPSILLGYTWRWWPPLKEARRRVLAGDLGRVRHARFHMAAHLADWHPWERYQDWFMADASLGGGALLDESHWIDQMLWFFGEPRRVFARVDRLSDLEISSDDNVDMVLDYDDGPRVTMHLDLFTRPHVKVIELVGDEGTLRWTPEALSMAVGPSGDWQTEVSTLERNDMFVALAWEFVELMAGGVGPTCTVADGVAVLRIVEAARRSSAEGRSIDLTQAAVFGGTS